MAQARSEPPGTYRTSALQSRTIRMIRPLCDDNGTVLRAGYLDAQRMAQEAGGRLPGYHLMMAYLTTRKWKELPGLWPAWSRGFIISPGKGELFIKGQDVVDSKLGWVFPASSLPESCIGKKGGSDSYFLFVDAEQVVADRGRMVVFPSNVELLNGGGGVRDSGSGSRSECAAPVR